MNNKWYMTLVMQDPINRKAFKRPNGSWIVVDYSSKLRVLDLHNKAKAFDLSLDSTKSITIAEEKNNNAGYFFFEIRMESSF